MGDLVHQREPEIIQPIVPQGHADNRSVQCTAKRRTVEQRAGQVRLYHKYDAYRTKMMFDTLRPIRLAAQMHESPDPVRTRIGRLEYAGWRVAIGNGHHTRLPRRNGGLMDLSSRAHRLPMQRSRRPTRIGITEEPRDELASRLTGIGERAREVFKPAPLKHFRDWKCHPHVRIDIPKLAVTEQFAAFANPHVQGVSDFDQAIEACRAIAVGFVTLDLLLLEAEEIGQVLLAHSARDPRPDQDVRKVMQSLCVEGPNLT